MISVIIPYKNAARWIRRCADSLTKQEGDFEFIFVNDSSEDDGPEILKEYKDDRFVLLYNSDFSGVSGARNEGLNNAEGDWITFLDADDELLPDAWSKYERMIASEEADIHQANHLRFYARKGLLRRKWMNPDGLYVLPAVPEMWAPVWNKLYKAELIEDIRFQEGIQFGEDELFNIDCMAKTKKIRNTAVDIMQHNLENKESLSHIKRDSDVVKLFCEIINRIPQQEDPAVRQMLYNNMVMHLNSKWVVDILTKR